MRVLQIHYLLLRFNLLVSPPCIINLWYVQLLLCVAALSVQEFQRFVQRAQPARTVLPAGAHV
jgi:hypothetical protein